MPLTDDEFEAMAATLCNKTQLGRLTHPEIVTVLRFMEGEGMMVDPNPPEIVTVPREELEVVPANIEPVVLEEYQVRIL